MIWRIDIKKLTTYGTSGSWADTFGLVISFPWIRNYRVLIAELYPCPGPHPDGTIQDMCFYECKSHPFWNRPAEQVVDTINEALARFG